MASWGKPLKRYLVNKTALDRPKEELLIPVALKHDEEKKIQGLYETTNTNPSRHRMGQRHVFAVMIKVFITLCAGSGLLLSMLCKLDALPRIYFKREKKTKKQGGGGKDVRDFTTHPFFSARSFNTADYKERSFQQFFLAIFGFIIRGVMNQEQAMVAFFQVVLPCWAERTLSGTGDWGVLSDAKSKLAQAVAQARSLTIDTICLWFNYTFHRHDQGKHLGKYFVQRPRTGCWTHVVVNGVAMELPPGTFVKGEFNVDLMRQPGCELVLSLLEALLASLKERAGSLAGMPTNPHSAAFHAIKPCSMKEWQAEAALAPRTLTAKQNAAIIALKDDDGSEEQAEQEGGIIIRVLDATSAMHAANLRTADRFCGEKKVKAMGALPGGASKTTAVRVKVVRVRKATAGGSARGAARLPARGAVAASEEEVVAAAPSAPLAGGRGGSGPALEPEGRGAGRPQRAASRHVRLVVAACAGRAALARPGRGAGGGSKTAAARGKGVKVRKATAGGSARAARLPARRQRMAACAEEEEEEVEEEEEPSAPLTGGRGGSGPALEPEGRGKVVAQRAAARAGLPSQSGPRAASDIAIEAAPQAPWSDVFAVAVADVEDVKLEAVDGGMLVEDQSTPMNAMGMRYTAMHCAGAADIPPCTPVSVTATPLLPAPACLAPSRGSKRCAQPPSGCSAAKRQLVMSEEPSAAAPADDPWVCAGAAAQGPASAVDAQISPSREEEKQEQEYDAWFDSILSDGPTDLTAE